MESGAEFQGRGCGTAEIGSVALSLWERAP